MRIVLSCLAYVLACHVLGSAYSADARPGGPSEGAHAALLDQFLSATDMPLTSYRAFRTLEAVTRGGAMRARLTAWTSLDPDLGFQYTVVEESGSGMIRRKVLRAALEAERSLRESGEVDRGALTRANYEFAAVGEGEDGLARIDMRPKRSDTMLVQGSMLLTEDSADLVRIEGRLIKRPSMWTRRVEVVRRYARISGARVPVSMQSTAHVLIVGTSTFSMTYEYESINSEPVAGMARSSGTDVP